ncbi:MAG: hypothetical protein QMD32_03120 [Smithellaceae bacterium]|nr:hypothetical protein [Smithellaceae bacterium]
MNQLTVTDILTAGRDRLALKRVYCRAGLTGMITRSEVHSLPDDIFSADLPAGVVLVMSAAGIASLREAGVNRRRRFLQLLSHLCLPALAISDDPPLPRTLIEQARRSCFPIFTSLFNKHLLESRIKGFLRESLDNVIQLPGCLVKVRGLGVLITGESGSGKTACSLELAARGHQWVSDDAVVLEKRADGNLYGRSPERTRNLLAIKGKGIVPAEGLIVPFLIAPEARVDLVVEFIFASLLSSGSAGHNRKMKYRDIMGSPVPSFSLPKTGGQRRMAKGVEVLVEELLCGKWEREKRKG